MTYRYLPLAAVALAAPAFAQTSPTPPTSESGDDPIVVTASRSGQGVPTSLLGASATVIDAQAMDQRQVRVVSDVLRDVVWLKFHHL